MIHQRQGDAVVYVCIIEMIIREQLKLEGLSEVMWFSPDQGRSHLPRLPRTVSSSLESLQGWKVHTLFWQFVPVFDCSYQVTL